MLCEHCMHQFIPQIWQAFCPECGKRFRELDGEKDMKLIERAIRKHLPRTFIFLGQYPFYCVRKANRTVCTISFGNDQIAIDGSEIFEYADPKFDPINVANYLKELSQACIKKFAG